MKSKTILIAILCTFLLLMLPNVNAIQHKEVREELDEQIQQKVKLLEFGKTLGPIIPIIAIYIIVAVIIFTVYMLIQMIIGNFFGWDLGHRQMIIQFGYTLAISWPIILYTLIIYSIQNIMNDIMKSKTTMNLLPNINMF